MGSYEEIKPKRMIVERTNWDDIRLHAAATFKAGKPRTLCPYKGGPLRTFWLSEYNRAAQIAFDF